MVRTTLVTYALMQQSNRMSRTQIAGKVDIMEYQIEPIKPLIGAVVKLEKPTMFKPGFAETCKELLSKFGALVFPKLDLTDAEQLAFTDTLGERANYVNTLPGGDLAAEDVYTITLDNDVNSEPEYVKGSMYWHMDGIVSPIPPSPITTLSCKVPPNGRGGQTEFANTYAAWDALPEDAKERLEGLRVMHTIEAAVREVTPYDTLNPARRDMKHEHPLVWTRPDGRKSLLIGYHADYVIGMPKDEGRIILNRLLEWAGRPEFTLRHEWSAGDYAMWDNTGMLHRAVPYAANSGRRMHRTSVAGGVEVN